MDDGYKAIGQAIQLYLDGLYEGDTGKLGHVDFSGCRIPMNFTFARGPAD